MWLLEKWFFLIWCWGSEAVSSLRFYVPLQEIYSEINHRNNPSFTSHTLSEYDEKKTQWSDMSNYSSFQNVQALLNVWYLWKVINMMIIIIIISLLRQWYGVIDAQPVNEIPFFK